MLNRKFVFAPFIAAFVTAMLLAGTANAAPDLDAEPFVVLKTSSDDLLAIIKRDKAELASTPGAIYTLVREKIEPIIDVPYMTALILGRHYRSSDEAQRDAFAISFSDQMIRRYADALLEYSNEEVRYEPAKPAKGEEKLKINSTVVPSSGVAVPLEYSMRKSKSDGRWKIYDVTIDGISMITNYRTQFDSLIKRKGIDGVIADLKK